MKPKRQLFKKSEKHASRLKKRRLPDEQDRQDGKRNKKRKLNKHKKRELNESTKKSASTRRCRSSKLDKYFPYKGWHIVKSDGLYYNAVMAIKKKQRGKLVKRIFVMHLVKKDDEDKYQVYTRRNGYVSHHKRQVCFLNGRYEKTTLDACIEKFVDTFYRKTLGGWGSQGLKCYVNREGKWFWIPFPSQLKKEKLRHNITKGKDARHSAGLYTDSDFEWETDPDYSPPDARDSEEELMKELSNKGDNILYFD